MANTEWTLAEVPVDEKLRTKNFDVFEERYGFRPAIALDETDRYTVKKARNGEIVLYIKNATESGDLRMNSLYDPTYEAMRWSEKFGITSRRATIAMLGISNGGYLRALVTKMRPDTCFFVFEPNEDLFSFICAFVDITDLIKTGRIQLFVSGRQYGMFSEFLSRDIVASRSEATAVIVPYYGNCKEFEEACEASKRIMKANHDYLKIRGRAALRARMYAWNHLEGERFLPELKEFIPEDIPAVIVAAGPSLLKNVEELKRLKGHALIICTDRAASVLDKYGIVPDMVAAFDTLKSKDYLNAKVLDNVPLLCSYQTNIDVQKMFANRIIYMHALSYENSLIGERAGDRRLGLDLGGNVAGGCFVACQMLGIKTIILIGQDLAFMNGQHHADGKDEGVLQTELRTVPGIDGGTVQTVDMWLLFKEFYERKIAAEPELRVIDATEGGALIKGTQVMTLREVADNICVREFDFADALKKMSQMTDEEFSEVRKVIRGWTDDLDMIAYNSKEVSDLCNSLLNTCKYGDITDSGTRNKLIKLENLLSEIYATECWAMLKEYWIEDMYSVPNKYLMLRNNEEAIPVLEDLISFFTKLPDDCMTLKDALLGSA